MFSAIYFSLFSISLSIDPSLHLLYTLFSLKTFNPRDFRILLASNHLVCSLISLFFMHFMHLDLGFGVFEKFRGFSKLLSFCWIFGMSFCLNDLLPSCIASHEHYNSIIMHLNVCNWLCADRIGLGIAHDAFYIACHMFMHFPCIRSFFSIYLLYLNCVGTFLIVSLSPSLFYLC